MTSECTRFTTAIRSNKQTNNKQTNYQTAIRSVTSIRIALINIWKLKRLCISETKSPQCETTPACISSIISSILRILRQN